MPAILQPTDPDRCTDTYHLADDGDHSVGRGPDNAVVISHSSVSLMHCTLRRDDTGWHIQDRGSRNGTFVNGQLVLDTHVPDGASVSIGRVGFRFQVVGTRSEAWSAAGSYEPRDLTAPRDPDSTVPFSTIRETPRRSGPSTHAGRCQPDLGDQIGPYRLLERIGQGATSVVYRAANPDSGRAVALKVLRDELTRDRETVKRFIRELRAGLALDHPNLVRMLDSGEDQGRYFIAMEYVNGPTLAELLEERSPKDPLPIAISLGIAEQIASALQHAFEKGLIHRDVKPSNILVEASHHAKLADLGLAKWMDDTGVTTLTKPGVGMGTLLYVSPEQLDSAKAADIRSDLYSLGATLYHMALGRPPVEAPKTPELVRLIHEAEPAWPAEWAKGPLAQIGHIVRKAMAKSRDARYRTPSEMIADLEGVRKKVGTAEQMDHTRHTGECAPCQSLTQ